MVDNIDGEEVFTSRQYFTVVTGGYGQGDQSLWFGDLWGKDHGQTRSYVDDEFMVVKPLPRYLVSQWLQQTGDEVLIAIARSCRVFLDKNISLQLR